MQKAAALSTSDPPVFLHSQGSKSNVVTDSVVNDNSVIRPNDPMRKLTVALKRMSPI